MNLYLLTFPFEIKDDHYATDDGELECELLPWKAKYDFGGEEARRVKDLVQWRIGKFEDDPRRHEDKPAATVSKGAAKLLARKARM